jgi:hypothetical protein
VTDPSTVSCTPIPLIYRNYFLTSGLRSSEKSKLWYIKRQQRVKVKAHSERSEVVSADIRVILSKINYKP